MRNTFPGRWRIVASITLAFALVTPIVPAFGQDSGSTIVTIDAPTADQQLNPGQQVNIGGWAVDTAQPGPGVDGVQVWIDGPMGQGQRVGIADYGAERTDVADALGNASYTNSGFNLAWTIPTGIPQGRHTLFVYAHSTSGSSASKSLSVNIGQARPTPRPGQGGPGGGGGGYYGVPGGGQGYYGGPGGPGYGGYPGGYPGAFGAGFGGPGYCSPYGGAIGSPYGYGYNSGQYGYGSGYGVGQCGGYGAGFYPPFGGTFPYGGGQYTQTVTAIVPSSGSVALTWVAVPFALRYRIYSASATTPLNFTVTQTVDQSAGVLATNTTVSGLTPGSTVYLQVRAVDGNGQETTVLSSSGISTFPGFGILPPPTGVTAIASTATTATLTWLAVPGATTYRVLVSSGGGPFVPAVLSNLISTGATVSGLLTKTTYTFQVLAVDAPGNQSQPSASVTVTMP